MNLVPHGSGTSRRVLVVDDNADAAEMIGLLLKLAGHEVQISVDGLHAVSAAASFAPHVMLLDISLPSLDGYEVARRIRATSGVQPMLVALTGWGQEEDRRKATEAGFDAHLLKPVEQDQLMELIATLSAGFDASPPSRPKFEDDQ